ncbi:hypothetical protein HFN89_02600 [Rhizobium laguerreae]|nr:hypothetical protein [Rhizobium laguerreae]
MKMAIGYQRLGAKIAYSFPILASDLLKSVQLKTPLDSLDPMPQVGDGFGPPIFPAERHGEVARNAKSYASSNQIEWRRHRG